MSALTYVELFAGAGGLSLGLEAAGFHPVAHCEIEPHARAVLRYRWPDVRLDGDVTQVNGADFKGVTLISGGSPCQDLSVAGKRKGLAGERSGLFHQQVRIWQESEAPYLLWENVLGALSSNHGRDFGTVLSTLVGTPLPVPSDGWRGGGVAAGPDAVAAWRVLDLQHFGPPQRRVRVFVLAARTGGVDPAEVLALSEGLCRHPAPRQQQRQGAASRTGAGAPSRSVGVTLGIDGEKNVDVELLGTLNIGSKSGSGQQPAVVAFESTSGCVGAFQNTGQGWWNQSDVAQTLRTPSGGDSTLANVIAFDTTQVTSPANYSNPKVGDPCHPLAAGAHPPAVIAFNWQNGGGYGEANIGLGITEEGTGPLSKSQVMAVTQPAVVCTTGEVTHALTRQPGATDDGTGRGTPIVLASGQANAEVGHGVSPTLTLLHEAPIAVVGTLDVHDSTKWGSHQWVAQDKAMISAGRPRRLTPLECERLMSWPDQWTATGRKEDGTEYALSDTARYRLCGNGVGSVCVAWFAERLAEAIHKQNGPLTQEAA